MARLLFPVAFILFALQGQQAAAQSLTLSGLVIDDTGAPLPGVSVQLRTADTKQTETPARQRRGGQVGAWASNGRTTSVRVRG